MQPTAWIDSVRTVQADLGWVKGWDDDRFWEYPLDFFFKKKKENCAARDERDIFPPPLFF